LKGEGRALGKLLTRVGAAGGEEQVGSVHPEWREKKGERAILGRRRGTLL